MENINEIPYTVSKRQKITWLIISLFFTAFFLYHLIIYLCFFFTANAANFLIPAIPAVFCWIHYIYSVTYNKITKDSYWRVRTIAVIFIVIGFITMFFNVLYLYFTESDYETSDLKNYRKIMATTIYNKDFCYRFFPDKITDGMQNPQVYYGRNRDFTYIDLSYSLDEKSFDAEKAAIETKAAFIDIPSFRKLESINPIYSARTPVYLTETGALMDTFPKNTVIYIFDHAVLYEDDSSYKGPLFFLPGDGYICGAATIKETSQITYFYTAW